MKELAHGQMNSQVALVGVLHALVEPRRIPGDATLKRRDSGVEIFGELLGLAAVQLPLNDGRDLPDLKRRQGQANAVKRINRIARIANDVPAISGVAPAAFPHVGAIEIGVHDLAAAHEVHEDGGLPPHAIEELPMRAMLSSGPGLPMERSGSAQRTTRKAGTVSIVMNFMASSFVHPL